MGIAADTNLTDDGYYRVYDIETNSALTEEPLGTKEKFWLVHEDGRRWLFKYNRVSEGEVTGDDWAEGIAGELADLLNMPHAQSFLASKIEADGSRRRGVAVWDFTRIGSVDETPEHKTQWKPLGPLIHGNELLYRTDTEYPVNDVRRVYQHTTARVMEALENYKVTWSSLPTSLEWSLPVALRGPDLMVGYLMLDAWIGNTDRHHENWGVIELAGINMGNTSGSSSVYELAPTYDHAASMGSILTEKAFRERLTTKDQNRTVSAYVDRGRSAFYNDGQASGKSLPIINVFEQAARRYPATARQWIGRLAAIRPEDWQLILNRVPPSHMTQAAREFVDTFLNETQRRLLELGRTL